MFYVCDAVCCVALDVCRCSCFCYVLRFVCLFVRWLSLLFDDLCLSVACVFVKNVVVVVCGFNVLISFVCCWCLFFACICCLVVVVRLRVSFLCINVCFMIVCALLVCICGVDGIRVCFWCLSFLEFVFASSCCCRLLLCVLPNKHAVAHVMHA